MRAPKKVIESPAKSKRVKEKRAKKPRSLKTTTVSRGPRIRIPKFTKPALKKAKTSQASAQKSQKLRTGTKHKTSYKVPRKYIVLGLFCIVMSLGIIGYIFYKKGVYIRFNRSIREHVYNYTGAVGLTVRHVYIEGNQNLSHNDVIQALDIDVNGAEPILSLSLYGLKQKLESNGWVASASVERQLPDTLHISIKERVPAAIWQHRQNLSLIDNEGTLISYDTKEAYSDLPILVGEDAALYAKNLFAFLKTEPDLYSRVTAIIRVGGRRWNIRINSATDGSRGKSIEIKLPEDHPERAWAYLAHLQDTKKLLDRNIKAVDLRFTDRLYIELSGAEKETKDSNINTVTNKDKN